MNKVIILIVLMITVSCTKSEDPSLIFDLNYMAHIYPANFVAKIDNPFLPIAVGSTYTYNTVTDKGTEITAIEVLPQTKVVMGITCTVVRDRVSLNGEVVEDTYDWFAQDKDGNVWYFGEFVDNYIDGVVANHFGSWESGVDGAEPGIIMLGNIVLGLHYRQEHYIGEAVDEGEVISRNETVTIPVGTFTGCIKIKETNPLDPDFLEYKYYAQGVGLLKVEKIADPIEVEQLISFELK
jgi:hypothetical protein